jgi:membrane protein YdbS with pleckstrin-like domain
MTDKKEFGADPQLKKLLQVYLTIVVAGCFLSWMIPLVAFSLILYSPEIGVAFAVSCFAPLFVAVGFVLYWIRKFHSSIDYVLGDDEIVITKGVWWKTKSVVPYNRITNVNIYQGPISRHFGLGKLAIQTAGFSGVSSSGYKTAEAEIFGIKNSEEIKDVVMNFVKGRKPEAVEAGVKPMKDTNEQILEELCRIRKAVEK